MNTEELQPVDIAGLTRRESPQQVSITMNQESTGRQFGYVNKYEQTCNKTVVLISADSDDDDDIPDIQKEIDSSCYSLFVLANERFKGKYFVVPKDKALSESTSEDLRELGYLTPECIEIVKRFPAVFANQNRRFANTDDTHKAILGVVMDVQVKEEGIWIYFHKLCRVPQQIFNERAVDFGIEGTEFTNELDSTHWSIKHINIVEALEKAGHKVSIL